MGPVRMTWTKKRPTEVGYYWCKHPTYTHPTRLDFAEVSYTCPFGDRVKTWHVTVRGFRSLLTEHEGSWWYGPIEIPDFPPDVE